MRTMPERIQSEIVIDADVERVWRVVTDLDAYPSWNRFTPRITLRTSELAVGAELDLDCRMTETELLRNEREVILELDPVAHRFCMGTSRKRGRPGIRSMRSQTCTPISAGRTHFVNYEQFEGLLAPAVYFLYRAKLKAAFARYCEDLARRVELVVQSA